MPLDPAVKGLLDQMNDPNAPALSSLTPDQARAGFAGLVALQGAPEDVASVEDRKIPGPGGEIPVRIYKSSAAANQHSSGRIAVGCQSPSVCFAG